MWIIISGILGILGFIISLINLIHYFITRMVNLEIIIKRYAVLDYVRGTNKVTVHFQVTNNSQLPISITDMRLIVDGEKYSEDSCTHQVMTYRRDHNGLIESNPTYNNHLPIVLDTLASKSAYLVFVVPKGKVQNHDKTVTFEVCTNRSKQALLTFEPKIPQNLRSSFPFLKN